MDSLTLTIEKLAGLGDGVATHDGQKVFVRYVLPGETVSVKVQRRTKDETRANLVDVITPSADRQRAPCPIFSRCGGCNLQHLKPAAYRRFKTDLVKQVLARIGSDAKTEMVFLPPALRRRVEWKVSYQADKPQVGYYGAMSHDFIEARECLVLLPELEALLKALPDAIATLPERIHSIHATAADNGVDALFKLEGRPSAQMQSALVALQQSLSLLRVSYSYLERSPVSISPNQLPLIHFGEFAMPLVPGAFIQAVGEGQRQITTRILDALKGKATHILDLFSGTGTYTLPLSSLFRVDAAEGNPEAVANLQQFISDQKLGRSISVQKRDLEKIPYSSAELRKYDAAVINPPRKGALRQCTNIAASALPRLVMISCNPDTFARDAKVLCKGGYRITQITGIDQFAYTHHLEIVSVFEKE